MSAQKSSNKKQQFSLGWQWHNRVCYRKSFTQMYDLAPISARPQAVHTHTHTHTHTVQTLSPKPGSKGLFAAYTARRLLAHPRWLLPTASTPTHAHTYTGPSISRTLKTALRTIFALHSLTFPDTCQRECNPQENRW